MPCLSHELILWKILVRLPTKSLLRLRCVCKAWRDIISGADPSFSQAHLHHLHQQDKKPYSLLIAPRMKCKSDVEEDPRNTTTRPCTEMMVTSPGLYLWEESRRDVATLLFDISSFPGEGAATRRHGLAHCDGLVLLPAEDAVRVLNPATRQIRVLPSSPNSAPPGRCPEGEGHQAFGFGRDHRSNAYKVARFFHRETRGMGGGLGMEVFTVGKDQRWRETAAQPPYPFVAGLMATFFKGSLIWTIDHCSPMYDYSHLDDVGHMPCFVRFNLEDESFSVMKGPPWYQGADYLDTNFAELNGELAMPHPGPNSELVEIWMCDDVEGNNPTRWNQRLVLDYPFSMRLIATFNDEIVYQDTLDYLWRRTRKGDKAMARMNVLRYYNPDMGTLVEYSWRTVKRFDVIFYVPNLVRI
ncbi:putative F-box protein At1g70380 [Hordeum vulgare subsp. vulgare]|nr:putative F-box protein At1g70380 [Hordeum vulgare subsp. vulgare]